MHLTISLKQFREQKYSQNSVNDFKTGLHRFTSYNIQMTQKPFKTFNYTTACTGFTAFYTDYIHLTARLNMGNETKFPFTVTFISVHHKKK